MNPIENCYMCHRDVDKILSKVYDKVTTYVDHNGKAWRGRRCPDCSYTSKKYGLKEDIQHRMCRMCNKKLDATRYFNCVECLLMRKLEDNATGHNQVAEIYL